MANYYIYKFPIGEILIAEENNEIILLSLPGFKIPFGYIKNETAILKKASKELSQYFEGKRQNFDLPLNPKGTEFQKKVWNELLNIPFGKTSTYKNIARNIGNNKATRAVGGANNKNPIAIIIPCHRIIGSNGTLTGYAGGLKLKEKLLNLEKS